MARVRKRHAVVVGVNGHFVLLLELGIEFAVALSIGSVALFADSVDFLKAYLKDATILKNEDMKRVDALPVGAARKA